MVVLKLTKIKVSRLLLISFFFIVLDRLTKLLALKFPEEGFFYSPQIGLKLFINKNLAFSLPFEQTLTIILAGLIIVILIYIWLKFYYTKNFIFLSGLTLIIIGATSNLFDRLKFQGVIDFIDIWFWPAFNFADIYIVIGIFWLIWLNHKNLPKKEL